MKKSKKRRPSDELQDRLSELPDSLIFEILWFLPMWDVVRTTVLSKRWNNLWTTTPYLNFDIDLYQGLQIYNRALISWKGIKILKLRIGIATGRHYLGNSADLLLPSNSVHDHGVEEIYFENLSAETYRVLQYLYSYSSPKVLHLYRCKLENHWIVHWSQLRSLTIESCIADKDLDLIVCGNPHLEVLILNNLFSSTNFDFNLSIQSSSLKKLSIKKPYRCVRQELRILSPNLQTLDLLGEPYDKIYPLWNLSSLTCLTLAFSYQNCGDLFLGRILGPLFPTIQDVEKLTLSDDSDRCIKVLGDVKNEKYLLSPLSNSKSLTVKHNISGYRQVLNLLQTFPQLETLVIQSSKYNNWDPSKHHGGFVRVKTNLPESFLLKLQTVEITCSDGTLMFPLVEILLKHASNLQKMVFQVKGITRPSYLEFQQKVLRMQRCSPTAELLFF